MKILVIGGMHGNEPLGLALVQAFTQKPVEDVGVVLANEPALRANCRFTGQDLNRSFPGNKESAQYEEKRAVKLLELCQEYDVVFDFHNTHCPDNDCSFVGQSAKADLYNISAWLGLNRVIVADYDCINKYALNCISIEISLDSPQMSVENWYNRISALAKLDMAPISKNIDRYKFVYRMTLEDRDRLKLKSKNLQAFQEVDNELAKAMGVSSPAYPIFVADKYTPYNYGGLLNKIM